MSLLWLIQSSKLDNKIRSIEIQFKQCLRPTIYSVIELIYKNSFNQVEHIKMTSNGRIDNLYDWLSAFCCAFCCCCCGDADAKKEKMLEANKKVFEKNN